jgi:hypothetical protein
MPKGIEVNAEIYGQLKRSYSSNYKGSEYQKAETLIADLKDKFADSQEGSDVLVGNRTIQNFFKDGAETPSSTQKTLDALVSVLLGFNSYAEALEVIEPTGFTTLDTPEYNQYWNFLVERTRYAKVPNSAIPIDIEDKYVDIKILEEMHSKRSRKSPDYAVKYAESYQNEPQETSISRKAYNSIFGKHSKNRIALFGGPGAGKTTFLKYLAISIARRRGISELFTSPVLPVLINLRELSAYYSALSKRDYEVLGGPGSKKVIEVYLEQEIGDYFIDYESSFMPLLRQGNVILMFDALDEVSRKNLVDLSNAIKKFVRFFSECHYILTSRVGSSEFDFKEIGFREHEIAEFDRGQVEAFAKRWFKTEEDYNYLLEAYKSAVSRKATRYNFLHGIAKNPLLLTMLFELSASGLKIPGNKYELYRKNVDAFFDTWDGSRRINRGEENILSNTRKIGYLGKIAYEGLIKDEQVTQWKSRTLEEEAQKFLLCLEPAANKKLSAAENGTESKEIDLTANFNEDEKFHGINLNREEKEEIIQGSKAVVRSLEEDDGILTRIYEDTYQFRHVTFQSYFAAEYLSSHLNWSDGKQTVKKLVEDYLTQPNWDSTFVFLSGCLLNGDLLLGSIFGQSMEFQGCTKNLEEFFTWLYQITKASGYDKDVSAWRAFYLRMDFSIDLFIDRNSPGKVIADCRALSEKISDQLRAFNRSLSFRKFTEKTPKSTVELWLAVLHSKATDLYGESKLDMGMPTKVSDKDHNKDESLREQKEFLEDRQKRKEFIDKQLLEGIIKFENIKNLADIGKFIEDNIIPRIPEIEGISQDELQNFKVHLLSLVEDSVSIDLNNFEKAEKWIENFRKVISHYLNIGANVVFDDKDLEGLKNYLLATSILLDCIQSDIFGSRNLRNQIIDSLFLPREEVEDIFKSDEDLSFFV